MAKKPDYFTDAEWAEWLKDHPDLEGDSNARPDLEGDGNVHPFPDRRRRKLPPPGGWPPWFGELRRDERNRVIADLANVLIALRREPMLVDAFSFDEMQRSEMLDAPLPRAANAGHAGLGPYPRQVRDEDVGQLQEWLQRYIPRVGVAIVYQAVKQRAHERAYHPVRDWLDGLKVDGRTADRHVAYRLHLGAEPDCPRRP